MYSSKTRKTRMACKAGHVRPHKAQRAQGNKDTSALGHIRHAGHVEYVSHIKHVGQESMQGT